MADKPYKEDEKKEYKPFDESEEVQYDFVEGDASGKKKLITKLRGKPVLAIVVLIVVVGVFYKVIQVVKSGHDKSTVAVATQHEKLPSIKKEVAKVSPATSKPVDFKSLERQKAVVSKNNKQVEANQQAIVKIQKIQQETQQHLMAVNQSTQQVSNQLNVVSTQIDELAQQVKSLEMQKAEQAKTKADLQKKQDLKTRAKLNYFVQAVIPGRAWLKSPNGQAITVAVGDRVSGYGKIVGIDSYSGTVKTSSGAVIQYGIDEK